MAPRSIVNLLLALAAGFAIAAALWHLQAARHDVSTESIRVGDTPATVYRPRQGPAGPVVLIAHGFAGSQQLMQSFALTFARNGYVAVTFDFAGHGRNPTPLGGNLIKVTGATVNLVAETRAVAEVARRLGDGRLAVLGHSMASDIIVRFAQASPDVAATIAISMFSPAVTATSPRNLLIVVGDWERKLKQEALRVVDLAIAPRRAEAGLTYGDPGAGSGRRAAFSAHVEHASVLYSQDSMREALAWLDQTFGVARAAPPARDSRGPWIMLLIAAVVLLARPLARLLPQIASPGLGAGLRWRHLWIALVVPMLATPLLLRLLPTHFLPVLVGDYLAAHFAVYGLLTLACLLWLRRRGLGQKWRHVAPVPLAVATLAVVGFGFVALVWPINSYITSFVPNALRALLIALMLVGTLLFFLSTEWLTRGEGAARGGYAAAKLAFLVSLAIAIGLDFERLFFLIIIVPVIVVFFLVYGLFSDWTYRRTGHPFVSGIANAVAFAWAIGVSFPLLAG